jgi:hypothetical protein
VIAALYSFFPVRVMDMHFLLIFSWLVYLVATLAIDRDDVSDHWRYPKQVTRIVALLGLGGIVAVDTHLRDFSMATKYILKRRYEAKKSKLEKDELRAKELLHNMLPPQVLRALEDGEPVEAECYASVTVLFVQLCDFEVMSRGLQPVDLVKILNVIFSRFDDIVKRHSVCVLASSSRPLPLFSRLSSLSVRSLCPSCVRDLHAHFHVLCAARSLCLLFTVTFYANLAHNLTRSP